MVPLKVPEYTQFLFICVILLILFLLNPEILVKLFELFDKVKL